MSLLHVPESQFNLFSITKRQKQRWRLGGDKDSIWIKKEGKKETFDIKIETTEKIIFAAYIKQDIGEVACVSTERKKQLTASRAHKMLYTYVKRRPERWQRL